MISSLKGTLIERNSTELVIECSGVGYTVNVSVRTAENYTELNKEIFIYTFLQVKEDSMTLFGFSNKEQREFFLTLISISGFGPKMALGIMSSLSISEIIKYIKEQNIKALIKLPGVGKKTAERLVFELSEKISKKFADLQDETSDSKSSEINDEALSALVALGFNRALAEKAIKKALASSTEEMSVEDLIKTALSFAIQ